MSVERYQTAPDNASNGRMATRVAVCGEVRSGKSTVLNVLLRELILPDNLGAETRPGVTVRWSPAGRIDMAFADGSGGTLAQAEAPDALRGAAGIEIWSRRRYFRHFELVEVPMTTAEDLTDEQVEAVRASDILVWVTIASQAWRLTERSILDQLAEARPRCSVIAISRGDKLRSDADRAKLMNRVRRETADYFDSAVFIRGGRDQIRRSGLSKQAWQRTGGAALLTQLYAFRDAILSEPAPWVAAASNIRLPAGSPGDNAWSRA